MVTNSMYYRSGNIPIVIFDLLRSLLLPEYLLWVDRNHRSLCDSLPPIVGTDYYR